jgi:hypothetical protein
MPAGILRFEGPAIGGEESLGAEAADADPDEDADELFLLFARFAFFGDIGFVVVFVLLK